ncbi:MAG: ArnT family glycosyltransferase [Candidatus Bathyarchaeia archaeon]|jgi:hypothetical protein
MSSRTLLAVLASVVVFVVAGFVTLSLATDTFGVCLVSIPLDAGWIGFLFIIANGFFFSHILIRLAGALERLLLSIGLGFGLNFSVMSLLGILGAVTFVSVLVTEVALLAILCSLAVWRGFRFHVGSLSLPKHNISFKKMAVPFVMLILIAVLALFSLCKTVTLPATEWDSLTYGVTYARIIYQQSTVPLIAGPSIGIGMSAAYPPGIQLTAASLYALAGSANDFYYRLLSPIFSVATLLVTYKFAQQLTKNRVFSVYAISALCAVPYFWELFIQETYIMALTFMLTCSAFYFYKAYSSNAVGATKYEVLGVLFCGFAALTSYMGLFALGIILLYALHRKLSLRRLGGLTALAAFIILPWYFRNLILLGNPLYPFFGVGKYLDPLLLSSTTQHFQHYSLIPEYFWIGTLSKVGAAVLVVAIAYLTFSKRRDFAMTLPYYLLFACFVIMGVHVAFPRYLILALPALAVLFVVLLYSVPRIRKSTKAAPAVLLTLFAFSSALMLPYINTVKPAPLTGETQPEYLSRIYEEGDAWQWINQNTPADAKIATFDIKTYYIQREVMALDGNESAPLYSLETIGECVNFLQSRGVGYVMSVPWATIGDNRMPPAYLKCPFTRYLGDPQYLPTVFLGINGTTVYHVGPVDRDVVTQAFAAKNVTAPVKHYFFNLTIGDASNLSAAQFYLPIPVDYRNGNLTAYVNSSKPLKAQLWSGLVPPEEVGKRPGNAFPIIEWLINATDGSNTAGPSFVWSPVDKAGYFTVRILEDEASVSIPFNITVDLRFTSYFENLMC